MVLYLHWRRLAQTKRKWSFQVVSVETLAMGNKLSMLGSNCHLRLGSEKNTADQVNITLSRRMWDHVYVECWSWFQNSPLSCSAHASLSPESSTVAFDHFYPTLRRAELRETGGFGVFGSQKTKLGAAHSEIFRVAPNP